MRLGKLVKQWVCAVLTTENENRIQADGERGERKCGSAIRWESWEQS